jgi:hypothetical protein
MNTPDTLSEKDMETFYKLRNSLYIFVNKRLNILPEIKDWKDVGSNEPEKVSKIRNHIFIKNISEIDNFINSNPHNFNQEELDILESWKKAIIADKFLIIKYLKEHTLFFGNNKVYGIKGLMDSFKDIFQGCSPIFIDMIILPFKGFLVHESLFSLYNISIGGNMASGIKAEAEEIIQKSGIITSLTGEHQKSETSDEDMLRFYMKSEKNREKFWEKIDSLIEKSPKLKGVYNLEIARINAKDIKSDLRKQGINGYFAVLFSQVIASSKTKEGLQINIKNIVLEEKIGEIYTFAIK